MCPRRGRPDTAYITATAIWLSRRELNATGKALYPVMRCFGRFSAEIFFRYRDEYEEIDKSEGMSVYEFNNDIQLLYPMRKWDYCSESKAALAEHTGIAATSVNSALDSLAENRLVKPVPLSDGGGWKVDIRTIDGFFYGRRYLNSQLAK